MRDPQYKWLQSIVILAYGIQKNTVGTLLVTRWRSCIPAGEEGLNTTRHAEIKPLTSYWNCVRKLERKSARPDATLHTIHKSIS